MRILMVGVALAVVAGGPALAEGRQDRAARMIERLDTDGDGAISRIEAEVAASARFARMDRDGDGVVSLAELQERSGHRAERRFLRLDANGDGVLDPSESARRTERFFDRVDANGDGLIELVELEAARSADGRHRGGTAAPEN